MKKTLLLLLFGLFNLFVTAQVNLDQGLVAHYPFDGNANDLSSNAINGTPYNAIYSTGVYGIPNTSILFNGSDTSYTDCGPDNRGITDTIAIAVFVRTTFNGIGDIVSKYDPGSDEGYHFQISLGQIRLAGRDGSGNYRQTGFSSTAINDSSWHHILGVVQGNTWLLYVDCNLEGAQSNATPNPDISSAAELGIGKDVFSNQKFLDCEVDEVRIYNRPLNSDERDSLCATAVFASTEHIKQIDYHLNIYPNPANDKIAITAASTLENSTIEIFDLMGRRVLIETNPMSTAIIDISNLVSGNYLVKITDKNQIITEKFVKQ